MYGKRNVAYFHEWEVFLIKIILKLGIVFLLYTFKVKMGCTLLNAQAEGNEYLNFFVTKSDVHFKTLFHILYFLQEHIYALTRRIDSLIGIGSVDFLLEKKTSEKG